MFTNLVEEKEESFEEKVVMDLPDDVALQMDQLKSAELANLMQHQSNDDIAMEEHFYYEQYI